MINPAVARLQKIAENYGVLDIALSVLSDPKFAVWSGSSKPTQHHYGKGGLAQHTLEVVELCVATATSLEAYCRIYNMKELVLAALFHDFGKIWDYRPKNDEMTEWEASSHKYKIHHIARSALLWGNAVQLFPEYRHIEDDVMHAILSHHGLREWGSPVQPRTGVAWILHLCDGISARTNEFQ